MADPGEQADTPSQASDPTGFTRSSSGGAESPSQPSSSRRRALAKKLATIVSAGVFLVWLLPHIPLVQFEISSRLSSALGKPCRIGGISWWLGRQVTLENVEIGVPESTTFAKVPAISARFAVKPLLRGRLEILDLTAKNAEILLKPSSAAVSEVPASPSAEPTLAQLAEPTPSPELASQATELSPTADPSAPAAISPTPEATIAVNPPANPIPPSPTAEGLSPNPATPTSPSFEGSPTQQPTPPPPPPTVATSPAPETATSTAHAHLPIIRSGRVSIWSVGAENATIRVLSPNSGKELAALSELDMRMKTLGELGHVSAKKLTILNKSIPIEATSGLGTDGQVAVLKGGNLRLLDGTTGEAHGDQKDAIFQAQVELRRLGKPYLAELRVPPFLLNRLWPLLPTAVQNRLPPAPDGAFVFEAQATGFASMPKASRAVAKISSTGLKLTPQWLKSALGQPSSTAGNEIEIKQAYAGFIFEKGVLYLADASLFSDQLAARAVGAATLGGHHNIALRLCLSQGAYVKWESLQQAWPEERRLPFAQLPVSPWMARDFILRGTKAQPGIFLWDEDIPLAEFLQKLKSA